MLGSARRLDLRGGAPAPCSPIPAIDAVIVLFVPPVVAGARGGRRGRRPRRPAARRDNEQAGARRLRLPPRGCPGASSARRRASPRSSTRSRPPARSAHAVDARRMAAPARRGPAPSSTASTAPAAEALVASVLDASNDAWLTAAAGARAARGLRHPARRPSGSRDSAEAAVEAARELGLPGRRQERRPPARTRPRPAASRSTSRRRTRSGPAVERIGAARCSSSR